MVDRFYIARVGLIGVTLLVAIGRLAATQPANMSDKGTAPPTQFASDATWQPLPQLSPEQVVQKQMSSLSAVGPIETRVDRCYRFASPENRIHTGPLARFATMVQAPQYQALLNAKQFLVGRATQQNNEGHLLVTAVDPVGELTLFRFFLSKQTQGAYAGCWMTDAVIRVGVINQPNDKATQPSAENRTI